MTASDAPTPSPTPTPSNGASTPRDVEALDELLSRPTEALVESMRRLSGDLLVLGVGGKMGPTLVRMARRASEAAGVARRIMGVSRFSDGTLREKLESWDIETTRCDLLQEQEVARLPRMENVVFMAGFKFGAQAAPSRTWAMNCYVPALVGRHFSASRIAAFSTGNVYGMVPASGTGSREEDPLRPIGEYAMTAVGRERMFEYFSEREGFPLVVLRLNYANELRYGVLVDLARKVHAGDVIDLSMGYVNVVWQGDANAWALQSLELAERPPCVLNLAGADVLSVRGAAEQLGRLLGRAPRFAGREHPDALLSDSSLCRDRLGEPSVPVARMLDWVADWVRAGGEDLGKPTHFESRDGQF